MFGTFIITKKCKTTNARVSELRLDKNTLHMPIFMPVATYGAMRGVSPAAMQEEIILTNTYHLRGIGRNIKEFMGWDRSMLTDSGGFQIQSLPSVEVIDEGVVFGDKLFTPENSMEIQMMLGADIMMQLDDVVNPMEPREKHVKAVARSIEWLDRAIAHVNAARNSATANDVKRRKEVPLIRPNQLGHRQVIFPIIQGGLENDLRKRSIDAILERKPIGLAIGGLSGGEDKSDFCRTVLFCCKNLPDEIPRYLMGVGYPEDVVVCVALGTDMSDCVYPTRTARFGRGFRDEGDLAINSKVIGDLSPISSTCKCLTCQNYSKSFLATIKGSPNFCMLMSMHNMHYMRALTKRIRESIEQERYPEFVKEFMKKRYQNSIPEWIITALSKVNVKIRNE